MRSDNGNIVVKCIALTVMVACLVTFITGALHHWIWVPLAAAALVKSGKTIR